MIKEMSSDEEQANEKYRVRKRAPEKPVSRRSRKKLEVFTGPLTNLSELIALGKSNLSFSNIDTSRIQAIVSELEELHGLIGLEDIKKSIFEQLVFYLQNFHEGSEMYLHTVLYGQPGTGKTTVAKLLGRMFSKLKVLKAPDDYFDDDDYEDEEDLEPIFAVARRDDLVGEYLGSTAVKTHDFLSSCMGGVVFIDEVYSLGNKDRTDSFTKECIDTINLFLSEHRDHFMMIVAGYKDEVDNCFFKYNEGLRRRFMWYHTIDTYSPENLRDIFLSKVVKSEWTVSDGVSEAMLNTIKTYPKLFPDNAGSIENFITLLKIKHASRVLLMPMEEKKRISTVDIDAVVKHQSKKEKKGDEPFLSMYM